MSNYELLQKLIEMQYNGDRKRIEGKHQGNRKERQHKER